MKGIKTIFTREAKARNIQIEIGNKWQAFGNRIVVPVQNNELNLFYGFHEMAHCELHCGKLDGRNYDDLRQRIEIEQEADNWANEIMKSYGYGYNINTATLGLISLYLYRGGKLDTYSFECEDRFIILYRHGFEIFSHFVSQLPMHPCAY